MITRSHSLPIPRQARVLALSRSSVCAKVQGPSAHDLQIMRRPDELHLDYPFAGSRMLRGLLQREGVSIGRRHVRTLMKRMELQAIYRRPDTSKSSPGHKIYPYLLKGLKIGRSGQVRAAGITWIPMSRGFVYLVAITDVFSRRILAHRVSIALSADFCAEALDEALRSHGRPDLFSTGQGSQFTGLAFTGILPDRKIRISMDGKGAWRDNVFVERLWRSLKYEDVCLKACASAGKARSSIAEWIEFYNRRRPHSSLDGRTPEEAYFDLQVLAAQPKEPNQRENLTRKST